MFTHDAKNRDTTTLAVQVARLYYYQGLTTPQIADELGISRPKVSRLLSHARSQGLVEVRVLDPREQPQLLEAQLRSRYGVRSVKVVPLPPESSEAEALARVAQFSANYLSGLIRSGSVVGLAWGTTLDAVSRHLTPKRTENVDFVQLNGSGNARDIASVYSATILERFAQNFGGRAHPFPVPTFFDYEETKRAMWRERSVRQLVELQQRANLLVYSVGAQNAPVPSHVYVGGYLEARDLAELARDGVVGDIATVFFRGDGSYRGIALNARATGPDLELFKTAQHALCVVSGRAKVLALRAALLGGYMNELITDERTARLLLEMG